MDSLDQGATGIPLSTVTAASGRLAFTASAGGGFSGSWDGGRRAYAGLWTQGGQALPLTFTRQPLDAAVAAAPAPLRPQTPKPPYPYRAEEVGYDNPAGHNHLAGTLTLPPGRGPFPVALLITGSGLQDRDETILGHKPFLVLADYLTRRGIAVLRVDDRTMGGSTGDVLHATTADFATDVEAGVAYLLTRPEIDGRKIGLIGHSEGGAIAPMVAAQNPAVAWIVLMAGPGVRGDRIILAQQRLLNAAAGMPAATAAKNAELEQRLLAAVEGAPDAGAAHTRALAILAQAGVVGPAGELNARRASSDWFRYFLSYEPAPALRRVRVPVLALDGSLDLQVPPEENLAAIRAALAGDRDVRIVELPGLNHLFQTARTGAVSEYAGIEETIAPVALKTIGDWVVAHTR